MSKLLRINDAQLRWILNVRFALEQMESHPRVDNFALGILHKHIANDNHTFSSFKWSMYQSILIDRTGFEKWLVSEDATSYYDVRYDFIREKRIVKGFLQ